MLQSAYIGPGFILQCSFPRLHIHEWDLLWCPVNVPHKLSKPTRSVEGLAITILSPSVPPHWPLSPVMVVGCCKTTSSKSHLFYFRHFRLMQTHCHKVCANPITWLFCIDSVYLTVIIDKSGSVMKIAHYGPHYQNGTSAYLRVLYIWCGCWVINTLLPFAKFSKSLLFW